ncbi:MAG: hypothetical protein ABH864_01315, partial [archaeon]
MYKKVTCLLQIFLLIVGIFSIVNFSGTVLADLGSDAEDVSTCLEAYDGSVCQHFQKDICDVVCKGDCINKQRTGVPDCDIGVCIDGDEGICSAGATRKNCDEKGGRFVEGAITEVAECDKHCCILGNEAQFVTEKRCEILSNDFSIEMNFDTSYFNADICSMFAKQEELGACTWPSVEDGMYECKFTSLGDCLQTIGGQADFHEGKLCSNEGLESVCEKQNHTACVSGLDGVYWFDSCGNRENIFDGSRDDNGWNNGEVLPPENSCLIGPQGDRLLNQRDCGNCVRLLGSVCAEELEGQELNDNPDSGVVCKDLGCDDGGERRENGETWCEYVSDFGPSVDVPLLGAISSYVNLPVGGSALRAMAAPGSEHYRKSCVDGEIIIEACGPYRNGICVESKTDITASKTFSYASCVPNRWAECLNYNKNAGGALGELTNAMSQIASLPVVGAAAGKALALPAEAEKVKTLNMMLSCEKDPDCFVKTVSVDKDFKFPLCVPKYPPGFYQKEAGQNDAGICGFASQMCSTVWVYESTAFTFGATAHWECKAGCDCVDGDTSQEAKPSKKFVEEMHALCVSLGDCGVKANYVGDIGGLIEGYGLKKAEYEGLPKTPDEDRKKEKIQGPRATPVDDSEKIEGKYIDAEKYNQSSSSNSGLFGFGSDEGEADGGGGVSGPRPQGYEPPDQMGLSLGFSGALGATSLGAAAAMHWGYSVAASAEGFGTTIVGSGFTQSAAGAASSAYQAQLAQIPSLAGTDVAVIQTPGMVAFQGATIGAAISVAIVSLLVGFSGIGAGVGTAGVVGYSLGAAVGGGLVGASAASAKVAAVFGYIGIAVMIIVIADIIAQWIAGVGEIRTTEMYFECKPWTAPSAPKCEECGKHGVPCNQYNCESLGYECEFMRLNEGVEDDELPLCVAVEYNDLNGP